MSRRTDPMFYEFDIRENRTKKVHRARVFCWWTGEHSIRSLHAMCDCQLGAFFSMKPEDYNTWANYTKYGPGGGQMANRQYDYLKHHSCTHEPSRKYTVIAAYLPDGDVIDLEEKVAA